MSIYDIKVNSLSGEPHDLNQYKNKVIVVVNVASLCGLTGQYEGLQRLYKTYGDKGLMIIGFPCNQFKAQEPGDASAIVTCGLKYNVTFPIMQKIDVNGSDTHPLYTYLKGQEGFTGEIGWNFAKFVVDRHGKVVKRYDPKTTPEEMEADIKLLVENK